MLAKLVITLDNCDNKINHTMASLFRGVLMEKIDREYGEILHLSELKPYSQNIETKNGVCLWTINTLNQEAYAKIILPLMQEQFTSVTITDHNLTAAIVDKKLTVQSYDDLIQSNLFCQNSRYITVKFAKPTAFKSRGEYIHYPDSVFIFRSIINKFDSFSADGEMYSAELLDDIYKNVKINRYNLKSTAFYYEGVKIPSFVGTITFKINGPSQMVNLIWLLARYGEYSGVGIKCAGGMGGIVIEEKEQDNDKNRV